MDNEIYSYTKIGNIEIGSITTLFYSKIDDTVTIIEDRGQAESRRHTFGPKAEILKELIAALQSYRQKQFSEFEEEMDKIRTAINS